MKSKHKIMLKTFFKVMANNKEAINKILPNSYQKSVFTINYTKLKEKNINTLIFDIDGTIAKADDINISKDIQKLIDKLKKSFNIILISNNHIERVKPVADLLNLKMIYDADKPLKTPYNKVIQTFNVKKENIAAIGDQTLTDIVGANEYGIYSILVDQIDKKNNIQTGMAQTLQKFMLNKLEKKHLWKNGKYY